MSLFYEALNSRIPGDFRATMNSLVSLAVRAIFIVSGPALGYTLDSLGMRATLLGLAALFTPLLGLVLVPLVLEFMRLNPKLQIELNFEDRYLDLVEQGIDVAIRMGRLADSTRGSRSSRSARSSRACCSWSAGTWGTSCCSSCSPP